MVKKKRKTAKSSKLKTYWNKFWFFIWEDNSIWSWLANIVLAFVLIKFVVYPLLGLMLSTSYPIVAVVSSSMEHNADFDEWWSKAGVWYTRNDITRDDFFDFSLRNGFNKGDIMILRGVKPKDIKAGDVIVFKSRRPDPIIHRVVEKWDEDGTYYFKTKGDNPSTNPEPISSMWLDETRINEDQVIGVGKVRVPKLGWVKIGFVELVQLFMR
ncbi:signal peptidase I [Nanoarchaeota archaeon]